jgi:hypothetical protein
MLYEIWGLQNGEQQYYDIFGYNIILQSGGLAVTNISEEHTTFTQA